MFSLHRDRSGTIAFGVFFPPFFLSFPFLFTIAMFKSWKQAFKQKKEITQLLLLALSQFVYSIRFCRALNT